MVVRKGGKPEFRSQKPESLKRRPDKIVGILVSSGFWLLASEFY
jgi:hypothetical protein